MNAKSCGAELHIGDDHGDNDATMRCTRPRAHSGQHEVRFTRDGTPVLLTFQVDERRSPYLDGFDGVEEIDPKDVRFKPTMDERQREIDEAWKTSRDLRRANELTLGERKDGAA